MSASHTDFCLLFVIAGGMSYPLSLGSGIVFPPSPFSCPGLVSLPVPSAVLKSLKLATSLLMSVPGGLLLGDWQLSSLICPFFAASIWASSLLYISLVTSSTRLIARLIAGPSLLISHLVNTKGLWIVWSESQRASLRRFGLGPTVMSQAVRPRMNRC